MVSVWPVHLRIIFLLNIYIIYIYIYESKEYDKSICVMDTLKPFFIGFILLINVMLDCIKCP